MKRIAPEGLRDFRGAILFFLPYHSRCRRRSHYLFTLVASCHSIRLDYFTTDFLTTSKTSAIKRREIAVWFKDNSTPENDALFDAFINNGVGQIADDLESIRHKLEAEEYKLLPLSYIATHYFGKSRAWLYQRINGMKVRGHRYTLNEEQRATFNAAVQDISNRIGSICI